MGPEKPGFLENMWVTTKYFRKKTRFLIGLTHGARSTGFFRKYVGPAQRSIFTKKPGFFGWVRKSCLSLRSA